MSYSVVILIDAANVEISARSNFSGMKIDYTTFSNVLMAELESATKLPVLTLVRPYYYDSYDGSPGKKVFFDKVDRMGYEMVIFETQSSPKPQRKQKCVDIKIAVDMIHFAATGVDFILLCSGDKDFLPAVEEAKRLLKRVVIAGFDCSVSNDLKRKADLYIDLTKLIPRISLKEEHQTTNSTLLSGTTVSSSGMSDK